VQAAEPDPALAPAHVNQTPGPDYGDATRLFQGIPGIERSGGGRLWATWYAGGADEPSEGPGNYVVLTTSGDDGKSWSPPALVIDPAGLVRAYDPCLWRDPGGRLWQFWAQSHDWWDGRAGVWCITTTEPDSPQPNWTAPRRLCDGIMMNKPTVLSTGEWLLCAAIWERPASGNSSEQIKYSLAEASGANVLASADLGKTWTFRGRAHVPERVFDEHMLVERKDGDLWMLVRARYGIGESFSADGGRTWTPGRKSSIPHVDARFFIRRLKSGRLLLVTHNPPEGAVRSHLTARLSDDDGATWTGGLMIDERKGVSYPDGVESPEGTIYLIYDYSRQQEKQILMATFTEADVLSGQWESPAARQRVLVNQATGRRGAGGAK
jgi:predicted neuraminidase